MKTLSLLGACSAFFVSAFSQANSLQVDLVGRYQSGIYGEGATEIVDFDKRSGMAYVVNGAKNRIDILALSALSSTPLNNPTTANTLVAKSLLLPQTVTLENGKVVPLGGANSISIHDDLMAVAVANKNKQAPGVVVFYRLKDNVSQYLHAVEVGALPDMVTFTPDGRSALVANEGEPSKDYKIDPEGSISKINVKNGLPAQNASHMIFKTFENQKATLISQGFKYASPEGTTLAQDIEPEYIAVSPDSRYAWVSLQENNAVAKIDIAAEKIVQVSGLGLKDYGEAKNALDVSDKDGKVNIRPWEGVYGLYQPDTIAAYQVGGNDYIVTANEGDARDYWFYAENEATCLQAGGKEFDAEDGCLGYSEETRAGKLKLHPSHPQATHLAKVELGRLKVTTAMGDENGDGIYEKVVAYGGRSFSIWDANGKQVFDSAGEIEKVVAQRYPTMLNTNETKNKMDNRSDDKGVEPEGLALGKIDGRTYAFVGLERMGGFVIYDITSPANSTFVDYVINRDFDAKFEIDDEADPVATTGQYVEAGDLAPEGFKFVSAKDSPTNRPLLLVANEVSGTLSVYSLK
ncbi:choice-of-anchor I family protein [Vibrio nigripulchritudo]|uniref:choice-of-anchor I family protein n=1 Tax=Vibrio nigripulchritudo TaxID=28173 RepID=UPI0005FA16E7|nr:choice-of-anchor I family protein [Vibrio nigripulchritudo]KJY75123.1 alkaline phosphatase [Vibrio nigripulchritudo]